MKLAMMSMVMIDHPIAEIIQTTLDCGLEGIDWITTHHTPARELRHRCDDAGIPVVAHTILLERFINREANPLDTVKQGIDDALTLGAPVMMLPPFARIGHLSRQQDQAEWIEFYREAAPLIRQSGIIPTIESTGFAVSPIITADEILKVLAAVPELKLTFDNGNVATAEDPTESYRRTAAHVVHVHFKDWRVSDTPSPDSELKRCGRHFSPALIGEGNLDLAGCWQAIRQSGYRGYVNLETSDPKRPIGEALKIAAERMRNL